MASPGASADRAEAAVAAGRRGGVGEGTSSPSTANVPSPRTTLRTLDDVMRAPSATLPDVIVLESLPEGLNRREMLDPKEDLWLSTADGRYSSPIIPLHVGESPYTETFYVHKHILTRYEYFEKALCGRFLESERQALELPDEDPAIFHFLVAFLYEGRYDPIKPIASVLIPDQDKGKGKETNNPLTPSSDSEESTASFASDISARSRRRRDRRRRRQDRHFERVQQKHPGAHRPGCACPTCLSSREGPPCWACAAPRNPPPPLHPAQGPIYVLDRDGNARLEHHHRPRGGQPPPPHRRQQRNYNLPPPPPPPHLLHPPPLIDSSRISGEDLRTWLLAYELNLDVYILANKFIIPDFKTAIARAAIDMLETAGSDAAVPQVLQLCLKLYSGLPESDHLLKMIFARVGFMQSVLWRRAPEETGDFLVGNPEVATLILRETMGRRDVDGFGGSRGLSLPSMETPWGMFGGRNGGGMGNGNQNGPYYGPRGVPPGPPRW